MPDVLQLVKSGLPIHNGYSLVFTGVSGQSHPPTYDYGYSISGIVNKLDNRLQYIDYYI